MASICSHLEGEHRFEPKVAVCPICSIKIARDMLSHITLRHGHLFKLQRRRKLHGVAIPNSLSLPGRDLREAHMQLLSGIGGYQSNNTAASTAVTDSLLSSLVLNFPTSEVEDPSKSTVAFAEQFISKRTTPFSTWKSSRDLSESRGKGAKAEAGYIHSGPASLHFV